MTLQTVLLVAAAVFSVGLYGALSQQVVVMVMMGLAIGTAVQAPYATSHHRVSRTGATRSPAQVSSSSTWPVPRQVWPGSRRTAPGARAPSRGRRRRSPAAASGATGVGPQ